MTFGFATSASQIHIYLNSVLNERPLEGAFNQEKALVGALSVIVKTGCGTDGSFYSTTSNIHQPATAGVGETSRGEPDSEAAKPPNTKLHSCYHGRKAV